MPFFVVYSLKILFREVFFMFQFFEDHYELTDLGYYAAIFIMVIAIAAAAVIIARKQKKSKLTAKTLAVAGISLALAFITSYIKVELPMGGSVTLFSMFFICFVGYLYGVNVGFLTAFAYSLLQFIQSGGAYFLSPFQLCCDYFFAFTALGITGFWYNRRSGRVIGTWKIDDEGKENITYHKIDQLVVGYIAACLIRGLFHTIGGYLYWMDYMPETFPKGLASLYSVIYNYSYILGEMIITLIVINLPPVKKALLRIKQQVA